MAIDNFIPQIWSAKIYQELQNKHVYAALCNRDYEGEIKDYGDTVKINSIGDITVNPYEKNTTVISPQELTDASTLLKIDQANYFAFKVDDIDAAQQKPKVMAEAMRKASYALRNACDVYIVSLHTEAGQVLGSATTPLKINAKGGGDADCSIIDAISQVGALLDKKNVPLEGRWMAIDPDFHQKLVLAGVLMQTDNTNVFKNGFVGRALGFDFHLTNNVAQVGTSPKHSKLLAGTKQAISFAEQILKVEAYRPESSFADAVKGLHVFGAKVVEPNALVGLVYKAVAEKAADQS